MQRFFMKVNSQNFLVLDKEDSIHVIKSLRMKIGEKLFVCDGKQNDYLCEIEKITKEEVFLKVLRKEKNLNEPTIDLYLYQAVPKLNKLQFIIQKAVELGAKKIIPVLTKNCVATIKEENLEKKTKRFRKIAKQAACQSQRGIVPDVGFALNFREAIADMKMQKKI